MNLKHHSRGRSLVVLLAATGCKDEAEYHREVGPKAMIAEVADAVIIGGEGRGLPKLSVARAGDTNGDGFDDILVRYAHDFTPEYDLGLIECIVAGPLSGRTYLEAFDTCFTASSAPGIIHDHAFAAGDHNDDGSDDLLVTAWDMDLGDGSYGAEVYLTYGPVTGPTGASSADALLPFARVEEGKSGVSVAELRDWTGDGENDLALSAFSSSSLYLLEGPIDSDREIGAAPPLLNLPSATLLPGGDVNADGYQDLLVDNGTQVLLFHGPLHGTAGDEAAAIASTGDGWDITTASEAGDTDGDGYGDVMVGEKYCNHCLEPGVVLIAHGPLSGSISLDEGEESHSAPPGFAKIVGQGGEYSFGETFAAPGDLDDDGFHDIVFGTWPASGFQYGIQTPNRGFATIFLGPISGFQTRLSADITLVGERRDRLGNSVAGAGDVDGDGIDDMAVTAHCAEYDDRAKGAVYLILGREDLVEHLGGGSGS